MTAARTAVVVLVMVEHVWFLVLEMFLWTPRRIFFIQALPALAGLALVAAAAR